MIIRSDPVWTVLRPYRMAHLQLLLSDGVSYVGN